MKKLAVYILVPSLIVGDDSSLGVNVSVQQQTNKSWTYGTTVTGWEKRNMKPSETALKMICSEFNVNYNWLIDGDGDIFIEDDNSTIELLKRDYNLRDVEVRLIEEFLKLDENERDVLINYLERVIGKDEQ